MKKAAIIIFALIVLIVTLIIVGFKFNWVAYVDLQQGGENVYYVVTGKTCNFYGLHHERLGVNFVIYENRCEYENF